jgi:hypothetical protein
LSPGHEEWILARLAAGEGPPDPLDDLISAAPPKVLAWMRRKALLADGTDVGMPIVPWQAIEDSLRASASELLAHAGADGRTCPLDTIARAGLLRDVGCLAYAVIGKLLGCSETAARHRALRHRTLLAADAEYGRMVASVARRALDGLR